MPLLNFVSSDGNNRTIHLGVALLSGQSEDIFYWVMTHLRAKFDAEDVRVQLFVTDNDNGCINAIDRAFDKPRITLCRWHFNKDVLTYIRTSLDSKFRSIRNGTRWENSPAAEAVLQQYYTLLASRTDEEYEERLAAIRKTSQKLHDYLLRYWLNRHKEKLVDYLVDQQPHFNLLATSKVEGAHRVLKEFLAGSRFDILSLFRRLEVFYKEHTTEVELSNNGKIRRDCRGAIYGVVVNQVTIYALGQTAKQLSTPESDPPKPCSGVYTMATGLPCRHKLQQLISNSKLLQLSDFHQHWWINRSQAPELPVSIRPMEPLVIKKRQQQPKTSHQKGHGKSGNRRDPSLFERVDLNHPASPPKALPARFVDSSQQPPVMAPPSTAPAAIAPPSTAPAAVVQQQQYRNILPQPQAQSWRPALQHHPQVYTQPQPWPVAQYTPQPQYAPPPSAQSPNLYVNYDTWSSQDGSFVRASIPARAYGYAAHSTLYNSNL
jgi:hypothetical protein